MDKLGSGIWTQEEKEKFERSYNRFKRAMEGVPENHRGRVIAVNFNTGKVIKSKCRKGRATKKAA